VPDSPPSRQSVMVAVCVCPSLAYTGGVSEMIAVVETEEFLADVKGVLSEDEHDDLILYVALHPEAGDVIPETGGLRKLRWAAKGRGKRGGSRVIYYFHDMTSTFPCS
jgi:mRNA-degrading endonuclease RelE of RelBE toxin-antitoxin system